VSQNFFQEKLVSAEKKTNHNNVFVLRKSLKEEQVEGDVVLGFNRIVINII
jgi:hypothetical protein